MLRQGSPLLTLLVAGAIVATALAGCTTPAVTQPSKVTHLEASQDSEGGARLTWDEFPRGNAKSFRVFKDGVQVANVQAPVRTWLDRDVQPGVTVSYTVAAVMKNGEVGEKALPVRFTWRDSLSLSQATDVSRGFANFTVAEVSPGLKWSSLELRVAGKVIPLDDLAYEAERESWTHASPDDDLVDLGETLYVFAPGKITRNRILEVAIADRGTILDDHLLEGRPFLNLTLEQSARNATDGLANVVVKEWAWMEDYRDVTAEHPALVPRWSDLEISVNGTRLTHRTDQRNGSWWHDNPTDDVIREGGSFSLRASGLVHAGAVVTVRDAVAGYDAFIVVLR